MQDFYVISWAALAAVVAVLAAYRLTLGHREDFTVHLVGPEAGAIPKQQLLARRIHKVEIWGESLTILMAVYGLTLLAVFAYQLWVRGNQISFH